MDIEIEKHIFNLEELYKFLKKYDEKDWFEWFKRAKDYLSVGDFKKVLK